VVWGLEYARKPKGQASEEDALIHLPVIPVVCSDLTDHFLDAALGGRKQSQRTQTSPPGIVAHRLQFSFRESHNAVQVFLAQAHLPLTNPTVSVSSAC
jgi:hypothetical protein